MAKQTYTVNMVNNSASSKTVMVFRCVVYILLVLITICVLILLFRIKWTKSLSKEVDKQDEVVALRLNGNNKTDVRQATERVVSNSKNISAKSPTGITTKTLDVIKRVESSTNVYTGNTVRFTTTRIRKRENIFLQIIRAGRSLLSTESTPELTTPRTIVAAAALMRKRTKLTVNQPSKMPKIKSTTILTPKYFNELTFKPTTIATLASTPTIQTAVPMGIQRTTTTTKILRPSSLIEKPRVLPIIKQPQLSVKVPILDIIAARATPATEVTGIPSEGLTTISTASPVNKKSETVLTAIPIKVSTPKNPPKILTVDLLTVSTTKLKEQNTTQATVYIKNSTSELTTIATAASSTEPIVIVVPILKPTTSKTKPTISKATAIVAPKSPTADSNTIPSGNPTLIINENSVKMLLRGLTTEALWLGLTKTPTVKTVLTTTLAVTELLKPQTPTLAAPIRELTTRPIEELTKLPENSIAKPSAIQSTIIAAVSKPKRARKLRAGSRAILNAKRRKNRIGALIIPTTVGLLKPATTVPAQKIQQALPTSISEHTTPTTTFATATYASRVKHIKIATAEGGYPIPTEAFGRILTAEQTAFTTATQKPNTLPIDLPTLIRVIAELTVPSELPNLELTNTPTKILTEKPTTVLITATPTIKSTVEQTTLPSKVSTTAPITKTVSTNKTTGYSTTIPIDLSSLIHTTAERAVISTEEQPVLSKATNSELTAISTSKTNPTTLTTAVPTTVLTNIPIEEVTVTTEPIIESLEIPTKLPKLRATPNTLTPSVPTAKSTDSRTTTTENLTPNSIKIQVGALVIVPTAERTVQKPQLTSTDTLIPITAVLNTTTPKVRPMLITVAPITDVTAISATEQTTISEMSLVKLITKKPIKIPTTEHTTTPKIFTTDTVSTETTGGGKPTKLPKITTTAGGKDSTTMISVHPIATTVKARMLLANRKETSEGELTQLPIVTKTLAASEEMDSTTMTSVFRITTAAKSRMLLQNKKETAEWESTKLRKLTTSKGIDSTTMEAVLSIATTATSKMLLQKEKEAAEEGPTKLPVVTASEGMASTTMASVLHIATSSKSRMFLEKGKETAEREPIILRKATSLAGMDSLTMASVLPIATTAKSRMLLGKGKETAEREPTILRKVTALEGMNSPTMTYVLPIATKAKSRMFLRKGKEIAEREPTKLRKVIALEDVDSPTMTSVLPITTKAQSEVFLGKGKETAEREPIILRKATSLAGMDSLTMASVLPIATTAKSRMLLGKGKETAEREPTILRKVTALEGMNLPTMTYVLPIATKAKSRMFLRKGKEIAEREPTKPRKVIALEDVDSPTMTSVLPITTKAQSEVFLGKGKETAEREPIILRKATSLAGMDSLTMASVLPIATTAKSRMLLGKGKETAEREPTILRKVTALEGMNLPTMTYVLPIATKAKSRMFLRKGKEIAEREPTKLRKVIALEDVDSPTMTSVLPITTKAQSEVFLGKGKETAEREPIILRKATSLAGMDSLTMASVLPIATTAKSRMLLGKGKETAEREPTILRKVTALEGMNLPTMTYVLPIATKAKSRMFLRKGKEIAEREPTKPRKVIALEDVDSPTMTSVLPITTKAQSEVFLGQGKETAENEPRMFLGKEKETAEREPTILRKVTTLNIASPTLTFVHPIATTAKSKMFLEKGKEAAEREPKILQKVTALEGMDSPTMTSVIPIATTAKLRMLLDTSAPTTLETSTKLYEASTTISKSNKSSKIDTNIATHQLSIGALSAIKSSNSKTKTTTTIHNKEFTPVCNLPECKSAASRMLNLIDHSVDPCNDFYGFACGGMSTDNTDTETWRKLSEELYSISKTSPPYLQTFKSFHDSCVSYENNFNYQERINGVKKLVKEVGEILDDKTPNGTIDLTQLFAKLILRQSLPFMDVDVAINEETSKFTLIITPPKRALILENNKDSSTLPQNHVSMYLHSVETAMRSLGFHSEFADKQILRTIIEDDILNHLKIVPVANYTVFKISDLQSQNPFLEWNKLFINLTGRAKLPDETLIQVYHPSYLSIQKINELDAWKVNNALIAIYAKNLYENLVIPQAKNRRENYCLKLSSKLFPDVISNLYMKTWRPSEIKESQGFLTEFFDRLKGNLSSNLVKEGWIESSMKLDHMKLIFNNEINDDTLKRRYLSVDVSGDFQRNVMKMLEIHRRKLFALVGRIYSPDDLWGYYLDVFDTTPTSFYSKGLILIPLGMVTQPLNGFPRYLTMARIGLSLVNEMIRYLASRPEPKSSSKELKNNKEGPSNEIKEEPLLSEKEKIASLNLISEDFDGFGDQDLLPWVSASFTKEQIFFITVAQEYCQKTTRVPEFMQRLFDSETVPASSRVRDIISNSKAFSKAFNCPTEKNRNR